MGFRGRDLLRRVSRVDSRDRDAGHPGDASRNVVLVEGIPGRFRGLKKALGPLGFDAVSVGNEGNALDLIGRDQPSLVFSSIDLEAKGLEGYELCYWEGEKPPVPLVYVRASDNEDDLLEEKVEQALRFLRKERNQAPPSPESSRGESVAGNTVEPAEAEMCGSAQPQPEELAEAEQSEAGTSSERHLVFSELASAEDIIQGFRTVEEEDIGLGGKHGGLVGTVVSGRPAASYESFGIKEPESESRHDRTTLEEFREEFRALSKPRREAPEEESPYKSVDHIFEQFLKVEHEVRSQEESRIGKEEVETPALETVEERPEAKVLAGGSVYQRAADYVLNSIRMLNEGDAPDLKLGEALVGEIVSSLGQNRDLLMEATTRDQEFSVSGHSVNVTILSLKLAGTLGWDFAKVQRVGLAALIHEIGVTKLPAGLTQNQSTLGNDELNLLRRRPALTAQLLMESQSGYEWLAEITGQVYERENGSGFPLGLKGNEISEEAKLIGLADFFEVCIHKRPYRAPLSGYQTLFELTTDYADCFGDRIVKALIKSFSLYPYNECVVLDSGEIGRVIDINPEKLSRPVVEILFDDEDTLTVEPRTVDLAVEPERYIAKAISIQALPF